MDWKRCDQCEKAVTAAAAFAWYRLGRYVTARDEYVEVDLCSAECLQEWVRRLREPDGQTFPAVFFGLPR